jgi:hypothetical protein
MIRSELARDLRDAGLAWHPASGDTFLIESPELAGDTFTVSEMTIEPHEFDTGTILGFNGTTEWALDSVAVENALWLPREDQLRALLGSTFRALSFTGDRFRVDATDGDGVASFDADDAAEAYGLAVLALIRRSTAPVP